MNDKLKKVIEERKRKEQASPYFVPLEGLRELMLQLAEDVVQRFLLEKENEIKEEVVASVADFVSQEVDARVKKLLRGEDGYTPKVGVDFYTFAERQELTKELLGRIEIPTPKDGRTPVAGEDYPTVAEVEGFIERTLDSKISKLDIPEEIDQEELRESILLEVKKNFPKVKELEASQLASKLNTLQSALNIEVISGLKDMLRAMNTNIRTASRKQIAGSGDSVSAGTGIAITRVNGRKVIASTSSGSNLREDSTTTPDGIVTTFAFAHPPGFIFLNGILQKETSDYTVSGLNITFISVAPTAGNSVENVYSSTAISASFTSETPVGTVDGLNVTFTVSNTPKAVVIDGSTYFGSGNGYTYSAGVITCLRPPTPSGGIKSIY